MQRPVVRQKQIDTRIRRACQVNRVRGRNTVSRSNSPVAVPSLRSERNEFNKWRFQYCANTGRLIFLPLPIGSGFPGIPILLPPYFAVVIAGTGVWNNCTFWIDHAGALSAVSV